VQVHELSDLTGTDLWLKRKKIAKHIEAMGQAITPFRSLALVAIVDGHAIIIDGHHRLMALWLLGQSSASAYTITIG
jgi:ParB-like chromosome segregation protein Spo0J